MVESKSGKKHAMNVQLNTGEKRQPKKWLGLIADSLHVSPEQLRLLVDEKWDLEKYRGHCARLSDRELQPPSMRRR